MYSWGLYKRHLWSLRYRAIFLIVLANLILIGLGGKHQWWRFLLISGLASAMVCLGAAQNMAIHRLQQDVAKKNSSKEV